MIFDLIQIGIFILEVNIVLQFYSQEMNLKAFKQIHTLQIDQGKMKHWAQNWNTLDDNNLEIICGYNESHFKRSLDEYRLECRESYEQKFNNYKQARTELVTNFDSYMKGESNIISLAKQFNILTSL